ncbi:molybdopterin synthase catalytic subunit MoaE [Orbaceae bacterium ESL0721]|nr:molybdopterin synthase catalytic subunit MoaE [Orbaceae bacterium ESL0721]
MKIDQITEKNSVIKVINHPFDVNQLTEWLANSPKDGAVVTFIGKVRSLENETISLFLEHYAGMTEKALTNIAKQARNRWQLNRIAIIHRVGDLNTNEQIVFVGVSSAHRQDAFATTEFIMDRLKNDAPIWKKERTTRGEEWIAAKKSDINALKKWL